MRTIGMCSAHARSEGSLPPPFLAEVGIADTRTGRSTSPIPEMRHKGGFRTTRILQLYV